MNNGSKLAAAVAIAVLVALLLRRYRKLERETVYEMRPDGPGRACLCADGQPVDCFPFTMPGGAQ